MPPSPAPALAAGNVVIAGGVRITRIRVETVSTARNILTVTVDRPGDFSVYTLSLVRSASNLTAPTGFDPQLATIEFSFKVACPSEFDCQEEAVCVPEGRPQPAINYLAKDYASFRTVMLDRLSLLAPEWKERNPADLGIALVELLAYVADYLSYQQDAIATEAYFGTARRRISVRRHARLVDYSLFEGCNARVWVQIRLKEGSDNVLLLAQDGERPGPAVDRGEGSEPGHRGRFHRTRDGNGYAACGVRADGRWAADAGTGLLATVSAARENDILYVAEQELLSSQGRDSCDVGRKLSESHEGDRADFSRDERTQDRSS